MHLRKKSGYVTSRMGNSWSETSHIKKKCHSEYNRRVHQWRDSPFKLAGPSLIYVPLGQRCMQVYILQKMNADQNKSEMAAWEVRSSVEWAASELDYWDPCFLVFTPVYKPRLECGPNLVTRSGKQNAAEVLGVSLEISLQRQTKRKDKLFFKQILT